MKHLASLSLAVLVVSRWLASRNGARAFPPGVPAARLHSFIPIVLATSIVVVLLVPQVSAQSSPGVTVTGVTANNSSARIFYNPVPGARDYRVYEVANPNDVKYAGQM